MTDDDNSNETPEGDMDGDNFAKNEKALGAEALRAMRDVEKLFVKHDRLIEKVHAGIIEFGKKLMIGRELYEMDNIGFSEWVTRSKLDTGRIFGAQQERTAAMTIFRLVVHGYAEDEDNAVPIKLDLTNCFRARPTDIIKWARGDQPMLFDDLRSRRHRAKLKGGKPGPEDDDDLEDEDMPDLGGGGGKVGEPQWMTELRTDLKAARERIAELEAEITALKAEIAGLREPDKAEQQDALADVASDVGRALFGEPVRVRKTSKGGVVGTPVRRKP